MLYIVSKSGDQVATCTDVEDGHKSILDFEGKGYFGLRLVEAPPCDVCLYGVGHCGFHIQPECWIQITAAK